MERIAEQQLSRLAELLLGDEGPDAFKAVIDTIAESSALRRKMAMVIRDHCAASMRPEVRKFAGLMEMKLRKHDPSRGSRWKKDGDPSFHMGQLAQIMGELGLAVKKEKKVGVKAADLANHAMMLADLAGELEDA